MQPLLSQSDIASLRTGRASANVLDPVQAFQTPLNPVAITVIFT